MKLFLGREREREEEREEGKQARKVEVDHSLVDKGPVIGWIHGLADQANQAVNVKPGFVCYS